MRYQNAILAEMHMRLPQTKWSSIFLGGGTPSLPPPEYIPTILRAVGQTYSDAEITCEANPGTLTKAHVDAWREAGVNRLSLGAQASQPAILHAIGRRHLWEDVVQAAQLWGDASSLSLDLMYGLPDQTLVQWQETLALAIALSPGHISCYSLIMEEGTPMLLQVQRQEVVLPIEEIEQQMQQMAAMTLLLHGYEQYEVSNWAKTGKKCSHNINYWQRGEYYGIGCAAASFVDGVRMCNHKDLDTYMKAIENQQLPYETVEQIKGVDALFEEVMLGFRMCEGVTLSQEAYDLYRQRLQAMALQGFAVLQGKHVRLTTNGMDLMNSLLVQLL